jgi:CDP-glycerol glycerophosphotransferase (TagB/SpsB family)
MLAVLGLHQIQLNHGDSDKAPSYRRAFRLYDKNFVAGQAAIDRFARHGVDMPAATFEIVGRPQVETITVADTPVGRHHAKTVLYAPTWHGYLDDSRYSSLPMGELIAAALLERSCTVIFRPHPWTDRTPHLADHAGRVNAMLRQDAASSGRSHIYGASATEALSLVDCFNRADAMIADVSSVVSDFVYSEKPYAVTAMGALTSAAELVDEFPLARGGYLLGADGVDWPRAMDDLLIYDPKLLERRSLKAYYLGPFPADSYAHAFTSAALRYL